MCNEDVGHTLHAWISKSQSLCQVRLRKYICSKSYFSVLISFTVMLMAKLLIFTLAGLQTSLQFYLNLALRSQASSEAMEKRETYLSNAANRVLVLRKKHLREQHGTTEALLIELF